MATRQRRLAEFNGDGEPPPDQPVQVLCEDHSGTYQLPFACRWVNGEWRNSESGSALQATVVGRRLLRGGPIDAKGGRREDGKSVPLALIRGWNPILLGQRIGFARRPRSKRSTERTV